MRSGLSFIVQIILLMTTSGCTKNDETPVVANFLFATPSSLTMVGGRDTTVTISGGVQPYVILQTPKANIATASLEGATVHIRSILSSGSSNIRIGDSAPVQSSVTVPIVVQTSTSSSLSQF